MTMTMTMTTMNLRTSILCDDYDGADKNEVAHESCTHMPMRDEHLASDPDHLRIPMRYAGLLLTWQPNKNQR